MELIIDSREHKILETIIPDNNINMKRETLWNADFIIKFGTEYLIAFERKTFSDLRATINGDRSININKFLKNKNFFPNIELFYIIEGDFLQKNDPLISNYLCEIQLVHGIKILRTKNISDTMNEIFIFYKYLLCKYEGECSIKDNIDQKIKETFKKDFEEEKKYISLKKIWKKINKHSLNCEIYTKDELDFIINDDIQRSSIANYINSSKEIPNDIYYSILINIPGVGSRISHLIMEKYTIKELLTLEHLIIEGKNEKKRLINIKNFLNNK